jgi:UDP-N-acetylglucosamine--N-acetylmuramyl-(pentapeptide) pyrophosphoryl-undecaprenol N-acetylglucosamine transferase
MEQRIVARESGLAYRAVPTAALRGRNPLVMLRNGATLAAGVVAAQALLHELRPAAILGTGGYVCVPLFLAARLLAIPTLVYLPDVVPGLAVRFLAQVATGVACSVEDSRPYLQHGLKGWTAGGWLSVEPVVTGYPVRAALFQQDRLRCRAQFGLRDDRPVLLVYGGSRGARSINRAIQSLLPRLLEIAQIVHVCGREGDEGWLRATADTLAEPLRARYWLFPYLESATTGQGQSMTAALGAADLAVCRSGASTLGELPALGLPAVLVPYPYVHQDENADYLVAHGAAVKVGNAAMVGDGDPSAGPLFQWIYRLLQSHPQEREEMARRSKALARPEAAYRLAEALRNLTGRRRTK